MGQDVRGGRRLKVSRGPVLALCLVTAFLLALGRPAPAQVIVRLQMKAPADAPGLEITRRVAERARKVLEERVREAGGSVRLDPASPDRLLLEIPKGSKQPWPWWQRQVTMRGRLQFKELRTSPSPGPSGTPSPPASVPSPSPSADVVPRGDWVLVLGGDHVLKSGVARNDLDQVVVWFNLDDEGTQQFAEVTRRMVNKPLAICLDDFVLSTPIVKDAITNGRAEITVGNSQDMADDIARVLNARVLPVEITILPLRPAPKTSPSPR